MLHERLCQQLDEQVLDVEDLEYLIRSCEALDVENRLRTGRYKETKGGHLVLMNLDLMRTVLDKKSRKNANLNIIREANHDRIQTHMKVYLRLPIRFQEFAAVSV